MGQPRHQVDREPTLGAPSQVSSAVGGLAEATTRLAQLNRQLGAWAAVIGDNPALRHDLDPQNDHRPHEAAVAAAESMLVASACADQLYNALDAAHQQLASLYLDDRP